MISQDILQTEESNIETINKIKDMLYIAAGADAVDNNARCFILAENAFGAAKGYKNFIGLTIGTGKGRGIIIDGKIYRGATGSAGEFGHNTGWDKTEKRYEWEQASSGKGLEKVYKKLSGKK